jgi:DNA-binding response OmpR family regulator
MHKTTSRDKGGLTGLRVLIVEDMWLVADDLAATLEDWGVEVVGPAGKLEEGLLHAQDAPLDGALLDVNLGGDVTSVPIAAALRDRGVPFVFLSGYDSLAALPGEFADRPKLSKPVEPRALAGAMADVFRTEQKRQ